MYLSKRIQSERILESISQLLHSKYVHAQVVLTCRLNFSASRIKRGEETKMIDYTFLGLIVCKSFVLTMDGWMDRAGRKKIRFFYTWRGAVK